MDWRSECILLTSQEAKGISEEPRNVKNSPGIKDSLTIAGGTCDSHGYQNTRECEGVLIPECSALSMNMFSRKLIIRNIIIHNRKFSIQLFMFSRHFPETSIQLLASFDPFRLGVSQVIGGPALSWNMTTRVPILGR